MQRKWRRDWQRSRNQKRDGAAGGRNPLAALAKSLLPPVAAAGLFLSSLGTAYALPTGVVTTYGSATVTQTNNTMTVNQTTNNLIVNSSTFNIAGNETLNLIQPSRNSSALWRVVGPDPSSIYGHLNATGHLYLINSNGVLFAPGAQVSVGGIVASTLNIADEDFKNGNYKFVNDGTAGSVVNQGTVSAVNYAVLLGPQVRNEGVIAAKVTGLAAGNAVSLDFTGDSLLNVTVDTAAAGGSAANSGRILAGGGLVLMSAGTKDDLLATVVNNSGVIEARSAGSVNGVIWLEGDTVVNSGTLDASGKAAGETGGTVKVLGHSVTLADGAQLDVSGDQGGGTALIGGNWQGKGSERNAMTTTVAANATINADALTSGNGGKVVVWADDTTTFNGTVSAKGGATSGDGGSVETSGKKVLTATGTVSASAPKGKAGNWLLDPTDYTIDAAAATAIHNSLVGGTDVTVQTATAGTGNGDIFVNSAIDWNTGNTLNLSAYRDVNVNSTITGTGGGNLVLRADNNGEGQGTVNLNANISLTGGSGSNINNVSIYYNPASYTDSATNSTTSTSIDGATVTTNNPYKSKVTNGSLAAYMLVNSLADLDNIRNNLSGVYALSKDIDANETGTWNSGAGWRSIGGVYVDDSTMFSGIFDGGGHVIDGLTINNSTAAINDALGLFGNLNYATISNLGLENVNIVYKGSQYVTIGALAGKSYNRGTLTNCYSTGNITVQSAAKTSVGGLIAGFGGGEISNSHSDVKVLVTGVKGSGNYGGFIGDVSGGKITNCYSTGAVDVTTGAGYTGGLTVGGFAGNLGNNTAAPPLLQNSYSSGPVSLTYLTTPTGTEVALSPAIGGLVGTAGYRYQAYTPVIGTIQNCYSTSNITVNAGNVYVGGLVGAGTSISNSYSTGKITNNGSGNSVGGLAGYVMDAQEPTNSFWDKQTTGLSQGVGNITTGAYGIDGVNGLTTAQMMDQDYLTTNFGFTFGPGGIWYMLDGYTRPFLQMEYSTHITNAHQLQLMAIAPDADYTIGTSFDVGSALAADSGMWLTQHTAALAGKTSYGFVPVGDSANPFMGTLTGNGNVISGLIISNSGDAGLFGHIRNATISNLGLDSVTVGGGTGSKVGALAGENDGGTITGVYSSGTVSGGAHTGGLIGYNTGSITDSYSISTVSGTGNLGGLVGYNTGTITDTYSAGAVTGGTVTGGLVGLNDGTISGSVWDKTGSQKDNGVGGGSSTTGVTEMNTDGSVPAGWSAALWQAGLTQPMLRWQMSNGYITTLDQLLLISQNLGGMYRLGSNIDLTNYLTNHLWTPIGYDDTHAFTGSFFGNGHTISGLTIDSSATYLGLFGYTQGASISGVNLSGLSISGSGVSQYVGGLVGYSGAGTTIAGCSGAGAVTANGTGSSVGGLVGKNMGSIINSSNTAVVTANAGGSYAGGLAGWNSTTAVISSSSNAGRVTANGATASYVGGIAGWNNTTATTAGIYGSSNTGTVTAHGAGSYVGGVTGRNHTGGAIISGSSNSGEVVSIGDGSYVGGLTGQNDGGSQKVSLSFNSGAVTARGKNSYVGGLFGINNQPVADLYNTGAVTSENDGNYVGGLAGKNTTTMTRNYNAGTVVTTTAGKNNIVGGLAGWNTGTMTYSFGSGAVLAQGDNNTVGGLVGENDYRLNNSYSMTVVRGTGAGSIVGGIAGENAAAGVITNVFNVGETTGGDAATAVGALAGRNNGSFTTALWATDTTGQSTGIAAGTGTSSGIQSDTFMNLLSSAKYAGWSTSQWGIVNGVLPYLKWQYPTGLSAAMMFTGTVENGTGQTINIVYRGTQIGQAHQFGVNGWYYGASFAGQTLSAGAPVLLYVAGDPNYKATSVYAVSSTGITDGTMRRDTLLVDLTGSLNQYVRAFELAKGSFSSDDIIYDYDGTTGITVYGDLVATNLLLDNWGSSRGIRTYATGSTTGSVTINNDGDFIVNDTFNTAHTSINPLGDQQIRADGDINITTGGYLALRYGATTATQLIAGGNITIRANGGFANYSGAAALSAGGRWLIFAPAQIIYPADRELFFDYSLYANGTNTYTASDGTRRNIRELTMNTANGEIGYDVRGGLSGDFLLWGGAADPATGSGFIFAEANPVTRPLTPAQLQRREAVNAVQSGNNQTGPDRRLNTAAPHLPPIPGESAGTLPFLTVTDGGIKTAPENEGRE